MPSKPAVNRAKRASGSRHILFDREGLSTGATLRDVSAAPVAAPARRLPSPECPKVVALDAQCDNSWLLEGCWGERAGLATLEE